MNIPEVRYAVAEDGVSIAYQVFGSGDIDVVLVPGFISHLELMWQLPGLAEGLGRLGAECRVLTFDKRGTGLSDRTAEIPDIDRRMLDVEAVMDAAGVTEASLVGVSEGGPMCLVFAATHPERTRSLVLWGSYAMPYRTDDHPVGNPPAAIHEMGDYLASAWGTGVSLGAFAPSQADDPRAREDWARLQRMSASPGAARDLLTSYLMIDARPAAELVDAPALVVHREGDKVAPVALGRELAELLPDAELLVVPGDDHLWTLASEEEWSAIFRFLGAAPSPSPAERFLSTVLFTDIVASTEQAGSLGDRAWQQRLDTHDQLVGSAIDTFGGRLVKHTVMACSRSSTVQRGPCGAPSRSHTTQPPAPDWRFVPVSTPARSSIGETTSPASPCTWRSGSAERRARVKCWLRAPSSTWSWVPRSASTTAVPAS